MNQFIKERARGWAHKGAVAVLTAALLSGGTGCKLLGLESDDDDPVLLLAAAAASLTSSSAGAPGSTTSTPSCPVLGGTQQSSDSSCALSLTGAVTTYAGDGTGGNTDGTGTSAQFVSPRTLTTDGTNLYLSDQIAHVVRRIVISTAEVTTIAGTAGSSGSNDGTGTAALFNAPQGITTDGTNIYVADSANNRIRRIVISTGVVTTLAGSTSGNADGTGTGAQFNNPRGLTTDGTNLYVCDSDNHRIRKIVIATGVVTTLAGSSSGFMDGTGTGAQFNSPAAVTMDGTNLYVAEEGNHRIRRIVIASGVVTTLAGDGTIASTDGSGIAAQFNAPIGITMDGTNLYVSEIGSRRIRQVVISSGVVTTPAGSSTGYVDGTGTAARFNSPASLVVADSKLFVADLGNRRIRIIQ